MAFCRDCGLEFEDWYLSRRGLCPSCSEKRVRESTAQMIERKGPVYDKYVAGLARSKEHLKKVEA